MYLSRGRRKFRRIEIDGYMDRYIDEYRDTSIDRQHSRDRLKEIDIEIHS